MSYPLKQTIRQQIKKALARLDSPAERDEAVHDVRKRFKKIRAILRLVRDELGRKTYRRANARFRDAAKPLTTARDAKVLLDSLANLRPLVKGPSEGKALAEISKRLKAQREDVLNKIIDQEDVFAEVRNAVKAARAEFKDFRGVRGRWSTVRRGLERTYRKSRDAWQAALADPSVAKLHEWRKQTKYLWHQIDVTAENRVMSLLAEQLESLSDLLGENHDLAVLRQVVAGPGAETNSKRSNANLTAAIDKRRLELEAQAMKSAETLFQEAPTVFIVRIKRYRKVGPTAARAAARR
jgi:hypothetical protein